MYYEIPGIEGILFEPLDEALPKDEICVMEDWLNPLFNSILSDLEIMATKPSLIVNKYKKVIIKWHGRAGSYAQHEERFVTLECGEEIITVPRWHLSEDERTLVLTWLKIYSEQN